MDLHILISHILAVLNRVSGNIQEMSFKPIDTFHRDHAIPGLLGIAGNLPHRTDRPFPFPLSSRLPGQIPPTCVINTPKDFGTNRLIDIHHPFHMINSVFSNSLIRRNQIGIQPQCSGGHQFQSRLPFCFQHLFQGKAFRMGDCQVHDVKAQFLCLGQNPNVFFRKNFCPNKAVYAKTKRCHWFNPSKKIIF